MQACQNMQQENAAIEQRLAQESQDWSAGEAQRREAARRAATAEAELELIDVSCDSPMSLSDPDLFVTLTTIAAIDKSLQCLLIRILQAII